MEINEATDVFMSTLVKIINESGLPMVNIELVLKEVMLMVRSAKEEAIRKGKERESQNVEEEQECVKEDT